MLKFERRVARLSHVETWNRYKEITLDMCARFKRILWGQTHDWQMGVGCFGSAACLCVCVGARESYLCHNEYVIKLPLRKDAVSRQEVHEDEASVLSVYHESLLCTMYCFESVRDDEQGGRKEAKVKKQHRALKKWSEMREKSRRTKTGGVFLIFFFFSSEKGRANLTFVFLCYMKQSLTVQAHSTPGW